ncbi:DUF4337 domain-containing protein [Geomesophilobacter sediminis]|uniref:DUF4337 domain-containing protein n=1 Tax=Geomesophilobacter sediminis TaxID=2798584 RepID=A0A8J7S8V2_9BACT|nr:DUF4337 domain-containing protein [Geomesophilobacter sediminis]MBJ6726651.1 DUF4337 domain-containing protein [Geomesophilobacter sediminis]
MAEEKKEPWLNYLALTTIVLAVCATLATFKGGGFSTRSILYQTQASDQWAFYQSKSIKGYLYEMQKDQLDMQLKATGPRGNAELAAEMQKKIDGYAKKIAKYDTEKAQIQADAKKLEEKRNDAQKHGQAFGVAVIFLQIAILLSSIAALLKKKYVWVIAVAVGCYGILSFANGFLLFM